MSKFLRFGRKCAAFAATAATFCSNTCSNTFSQGSSTVAALYFLIVRCISRLKSTFYSRVGSSSSNTFQNFAQENEHLREGNVISPVDDDFPDSHDLGDEFDHEDYDEWWYGDERDYEDELNEWDDEPLDPVEEVVSWTRRAVDEIIAEEDGEHGTIGQCHGGDLGVNGE